ncbi:NAD-dependent epimerase/dehydratase family protein [Paenibacillus lemnae]|uniref:NAD-dependent epimerase/dehydratase family protein n=1 Tax=Paenibacillus lemnae TaxID=1330551 RepID=A0A848M602_PAELE|nr:NAD-dependent epimerase/dehydratase family protein [Paenibacillus lemnae]NMO95243.1 NAD-dependent epimerase/dehydratase family protein [Paenibacillus lemnae]
MAERSINPDILITGASGFTGRHACAHFVSRGWNVTAVVRKNMAAQSDAGLNFKVCELQDRRQVCELIDETAPDYVLHLAGKNSVPESWKDPAGFMEANLMAPVYLLEAMRQVRPDGRMLLVGSRLGVDPAAGAANVPHPYSLSKTLGRWVSEAWAALFKMPVLIAEPSNLVGPGESTGFCMLLAKYIAGCEQGRELPVFQISSRNTSRNFLDVRDAVCAYEKLLISGTPGKVYPVTGSVEWTLGEIAEVMLQEAKGPVPVNWGDDDEAKASSRVQKETEHPSIDLIHLGWRQSLEMNATLNDILAYARSES